MKFITFKSDMNAVKYSFPANWIAHIDMSANPNQISVMTKFAYFGIPYKDYDEMKRQYEESLKRWGNEKESENNIPSDPVEDAREYPVYLMESLMNRPCMPKQETNIVQPLFIKIKNARVRISSINIYHGETSRSETFQLYCLRINDFKWFFDTPEEVKKYIDLLDSIFNGQIAELEIKGTEKDEKSNS